MYSEIGFILRLSSRLKNFKRVDTKRFEFSCNICGDSKKRIKRRGNFFIYKNSYWFNCYNCGASMPLKKYLELYFFDLYKEYLFDKIKVKTIKDKPKEKKYSKPEFKLDSNSLIKLSSLPANHDAVKYIKNRQLPVDKFYYVEKFNTWTNKLKNIDKKVSKDHSRIIIPIFDINKKLIAYQGRSYRNEIPKYLTVKLDEESDKIYGLDTVNLDKVVYVLEGIMDTFFVENSVAVMDTNYLKIKKYTDNFVVIPDADLRNKQVLKAIEKCIITNTQVCLLPNNKGKDINEMIINGEKNIKEIIKNHTYSGLKLKLEYNKWKRGK